MTSHLNIVAIIQTWISSSRYMRNANVGGNLHYIPVYRHSYYVENFDFDPEKFPVTEDVFRRIVTLPLFPRMNKHELSYICNKIENYQR